MGPIMHIPLGNLLVGDVHMLICGLTIGILLGRWRERRNVLRDA